PVETTPQPTRPGTAQSAGNTASVLRCRHRGCGVGPATHGSLQTAVERSVGCSELQRRAHYRACSLLAPWCPAETARPARVGEQVNIMSKHRHSTHLSLFVGFLLMTSSAAAGQTTAGAGQSTAGAEQPAAGAEQQPAAGAGQSTAGAEQQPAAGAGQSTAGAEQQPAAGAGQSTAGAEQQPAAGAGQST